MQKDRRRQSVMLDRERDRPSKIDGATGSNVRLIETFDVVRPCEGQRLRVGEGAASRHTFRRRLRRPVRVKLYRSAAPPPTYIFIRT